MEIEHKRNPVKAIRLFCIECMGGSFEEVKNCSSQKCAIYPFRLGKNPFRTERVVSDEQRQAATERFAKIRLEKSKGE